MSFTVGELDVVKAYFEEMIGCVVGCGCWEPGWDAEPAIRRLAESELVTCARGMDELLGNAALESIENLQATLVAADMVAVSQRLELHLPTVLDFQQMFGPSATLLAVALRGD